MLKEIHKIQAKPVAVRGNDIDTDRIIPARYLKETSFERMGEYAFYDERFSQDGKELDHPFNRYKGAGILIANQNFGCGSSREHAPQALMRWGVMAIIAESYAEIFAGNCTMIGVPPLTADKKTIEELQNLAESAPSQEWEIDLDSLNLSVAGKTYKLSMPEGRREAFIKGYWDSTSLLLSNLEKTKKVAEALPYVKGF
ncbi:3-isopropylmalate dehydratase small subunit [Spirochaetia bacterium 38H-sp]|uniref:3-isopropylmalate dehydratase n=1 Tax=Rarispira pelagica TaxID=3141764 RepID=A0ABU9U9E3_9SPIR